MKNFIAVILILSLMGSMLMGCQKKDSPVAENSKQAASEAKSSPTKKTKIEYWHVNAETQGGLTVSELVKKFNEQNDHIEVVARYNPDMYKGLMQNLQAEQASGKTPAIVQVGWAFLDYFSNNFAYVSPQDAIAQYDGKDANFLTENFLPNILDLAKNKEKEQVGIPYSLSTPVLYINRDLLKQCGLSPQGPKTWKEVAEFAKVIKEKTGKYGFYMQEPQDFWAQQALMESNGAKVLTIEGGKAKASFDSPEGEEAFALYAQMVLKDKSALHIAWDQGVQSFVDGNVAMCYTTIARRASIQKSAKFDVAAIKSPLWEGKERKVPAGGCFLAITAKEKDQIEAAWEFEKFLYSIDSMAAWTKGTGYVPPRKGVAEAENGLKGFLAENAMMKPAIEQMEAVVPWASFPGDSGLQAEQLLLDMRDKILSGQVPVKEGLKEAQDSINKIIQ